MLKATKTAKSSADVIVVSGNTPSNKKRTFRFKVISEKQQLKERNAAYQFFSIG